MRQSFRSRAKGHRANIEPLEGRRLLAVVSGSVFTDANYNGRQDSNESVAVGQGVFLDTNDNNAFDPGELRSESNANGAYAFRTVATGTYRLRPFLSAGNLATTGDGATVVVADGASNEAVIAPRLGVAAAPEAGSISGYVFRDEDNTGTPTAGDIFTGQTGLFFLDTNDNAAIDPGEATVQADTNGRFKFGNLSPGTYTVRAAVQFMGLRSPGTYVHTVMIGNGSPEAATNLAYALFKGSTLAQVSFFRDNDGDGLRGSSEYGLGLNAAAYIDLNNDGKRQSIEPTLTNNDAIGYFSDDPVAGLPSGTYTVRAIAGSDFVSTTGSVTVQLKSGFVPQVNLGFLPKAQPYSISGTVFHDANGNGVRDSDETGWPVSAAVGSPVRVYLDADNDGVLDADETSTTANSAGNYTLQASAGTGQVTVRVQKMANYVQTAPTADAGRVVTPGPTPVTGQNFGLAPLGGVRGVMFSDANRNNAFDTGEQPLNGYFVWVDLNNDGLSQVNEPSTITGSAAGGAGNWTIGGLKPGTYTVRQTLPAGHRAVVSSTFTVTIAGNYAYVVFANTNTGGASISGVAFNDANDSGTKDSIESGLQYVLVYDDTDNDGKRDPDEQAVTTDADGRYTLAALAPGTHRIRASFQSYQENTNPGPAGYSITLAENDVRTGVNFAGRDDRPVTVGGYVFEDANRNGVKDDNEAGVSGVYAFIDYGRDGKLDSNDVIMETDASGFWSLQFQPDRETRIAFYNPARRTLTTPASYDVVPKVGRPVVNVNFGLAPVTPPAPAGLSGFTFDDTDKDGVYDSNEKKTSGKTVFIDDDNDGVLDASEARTVTLADGSWKFTNLVAGLFHVRRVFPSGYTQSTASIDIDLVAGQTVTGLAIGSKSGSVTPPPTTKTASIAGTVFSDNNKNGKYDSGDGYGKGVVVFLDADNDGKLDSGETSVTTDSSGKFTFTKLAAGTYRVRRVMPSGYTYSTSKPDVTLTNGQAKTGVLIGTKKA